MGAVKQLVQALSAHGALDLWSARFVDPVRERAFKAYSVVRNGPTERFIMVSGTGIHVAYGLLDFMTIGAVARESFLIRLLGFFVLLPLIGWTLTTTGRKYLMWVAAAVVVVMAVSMGMFLKMMGTISPPYYVGFIHLSLVFSSVVQINFLLCVSLLIFNYLMFVWGMPVVPSNVDLIAAHFFLTATFLSCATVNYVLERSRRLEFVEYRDKQRYYAQVQEMANAAEGSLRRRNALLNVLGHVVKTPLHQIIGYGQVIEMTARTGNDSNEIVGFSEEIIRAGQTLSHQSQRILDYSRAEAGLLNVNIQSTTPLRLVNEAIHRHRTEAEEKRLQIEVNCSEDAVRVDPRHLANAIDELIGNAVRYCPPGSTLQVGTDTHEKSVTLFILDNGPGIAEQDIGRVSDALNQTEDFRNVGGDRLGIGVSLARILIKIAGARLYFSSFPGIGCLAEIVLPRPDEASASTTVLKRAS